MIPSEASAMALEIPARVIEDEAQRSFAKVMVLRKERNKNVARVALGAVVEGHELERAR